MAKKRSARSERRPTRKQTSRREREKRVRQWLVIGTAGVLGLVVLILGWGLYDQYVLRPRRSVATVSGVPIRLEGYQSLVRYRRWSYGNYLSRLEEQSLQVSSSEEEGAAFLLQYLEQQIEQIGSELTNLPTTVLEELIDDQLVRQECARLGITISSEEIQLRLEQQFGYERVPPTPVPTLVTATLPITITPTPTTAPMTRDEFVEQSTAWLQAMREASGFTEEQLRGLLERSLYREKLAEAISTEVPRRAEQIHARHILVETREEADDVLSRLRSGGDFGALAAELSADSSTREEGGDLGWFPRGQMVPEFDQVAFGLQPGETSQVVETQFGFHIIRVDERAPDRELDELALRRAQDQGVSDWFTQQRIIQDIVRSWDSTMVP